MAYTPAYHPDVAARDLPLIDRRQQGSIETAIRERLLSAPEKFGEPLRRDLAGHRKLRVGDYRVIYRVVGREVWILAIMNRKVAYRRVGPRVGWKKAGVQ